MRQYEVQMADGSFRHATGETKTEAMRAAEEQARAGFMGSAKAVQAWPVSRLTGRSTREGR